MKDTRLPSNREKIKAKQVDPEWLAREAFGPGFIERYQEMKPYIFSQIARLTYRSDA